jgi:predicted acetyltransferase
MTTVKINNQLIESFISEQTSKQNISTVDYLTSLILNEIEFLEIKKDIKNLELEIKDVNNGTIKLKSARNLLDEL